MKHSYESYRAAMLAQDVTPLSKAAWEREQLRARPHHVDFEVTPEMARRGRLPVGKYRNYFGYNQIFLRTERLL